MFRTSEHLERLPGDAAAELERIVERFEGAWARGERPALDGLLPPAEPLRRAVLVELIFIDLESRLKAGEPVRLESYLQRYPDLAADAGAVLALAAREFELRRRREPALAPAEYLRRFPHLAADLRPLLEGLANAHGATLADVPPRPAPPPRIAPMDNVADLVRSLHEHRLVEPSRQEELTVLQGRFTEPRGLARELLQRDWLTPFQMNQVFQGKGAELVLGPYVLLERLGEGGMGQVFKARHLLMNRVVALKVIRKERLAGPDAVRRFHREIRAAAQLSHPNIVLAYDAAEVNGTHFLVMEYVEGADLGRVIKKQKGPLPVAMACDYVRQAALGLEHAHEKGLVHRDVKPANLLLTKTGMVKVLDLGLARLDRVGPNDQTAADLTQEGAVMGTPDYMAPEQAQESHSVDGRADVYSLGSTLYYLLTGQVPFPGGTLAQKLLRQQTKEPAAVESLRPEVPAGLANAVRRMMAKKPEDRYATPGAVAAALAPFCGAAPPAALPLAPAELHGVTARPPEARLVTATPAAAFPVALPAAVVAVPPLALPAAPAAEETLPPSVPDSVPSEDGLRRQPAARGPRRLWQRLGRRGRLACVGAAALAVVLLLVLVLRKPSPPPTPEPDLSRLTPLERLDPKDIPPEDRLDWHAKLPAPVQVVAVLGKHRVWHPNAIGPLALDPMGKHLVTCGTDQSKRFSDPESLRQRRNFPGEGDVYQLAFSADGKRVASAHVSGLIVVRDADGREEPIRLTPGLGSIGTVALSNDGKVLFSNGKSVCLWDVATGKELRQFVGHTAPVVQVALTPDGKCAITGGGKVDPKTTKPVDCALRLWNVETGEQVGQFEGAAGRVPRLGLSRDGTRLAALDPDKLLVWDVASRKLLASIVSPGPLAGVLALSPDGKRLATGGGNPTHIILWELQESELRSLTTFLTAGVPTGLAFFPDGRRILFGDGNTVRVWDTESRKEVRPWVGHHNSVTKAVFAPDGRTVFSGGIDDHVLMWDLTDRKPRLLATTLVADLAVAYQDDNHRYACVLTAARNGRQPALELYEIPTGRLLRQVLPANSRFAATVAASPDGHSALVGLGGGGLALWEVPKGKEPRLYKTKAVVTREIFSPDGKQIVSLDTDGSLQLWDVTTAKPGVSLLHPGGATVMAFTPDGARVYYGTPEGKVGVWDPKATTQAPPSLSWHQGRVRALAVSPDGKTLVSASDEFRLVLWDAGKLEKIAAWKTSSWVNTIAFGDNRHFLTANGDSTIDVYRLKQK